MYTKKQWNNMLVFDRQQATCFYGIESYWKSKLFQVRIKFCFDFYVDVCSKRVCSSNFNLPKVSN
jgi:hypothetical protein